MSCEKYQRQISAWMDAELPDEASQSLETHLESCSDCSEVAAQLMSDNDRMARELAFGRDVADAVAHRTIRQLGLETRSSGSLNSKWMHLLLAAAAGFLLALVVMRPVRNNGSSVNNVPQDPNNEVAQLTLATGKVDYQVREQPWITQTVVDPISLPLGARLRTGDDTKCELRTSKGCTVRLDKNTTVTIASTDGVQLEQGQLWCNIPANVPFEVAGKQAVASCTTGQAAGQLDVQCQPDHEAFTAVQGALRLVFQEAEHEIPAGNTVQVVGTAMHPARAQNLVEATAWMTPLLMMKGHRDEELESRVNQVLAQVGQAKMSYMFEDELRSLGDYCVLPLTRYVQSPLSTKEPAKRRMAMRILSDLAQVWSAGDLIELLADDDPDIRYAAAAALQRLTRMTHNRQPSQWRGDWNSCIDTHKQWQVWWSNNRSRFPQPPVKKIDPASIKTIQS